VELDLAGKVGIVTGASRGIGAAIARELAGEGCSLVLAARSIKASAEPGRIISEPSDLTKPESAARLIAATIEAFGRLDFVVCNAGAAKMGALAELSDDDWMEGFALKFFGHVRLVREAWPHLRRSKGAVLMIAGRAGRTPGATGLITGAVNSAILNFAKGMASQGIADKVRVNAINPGSIRTERFTERVRKAAASLGISEREAEGRVAPPDETIRIGDPEDIAALAAFVLSRRGANLHGALIDSDGGKTKTL
jgi:3-oxoacyl-[acyl-carrier protein] reductase